MKLSKQINYRMVWIDWMKVWATLAVIWGHFFAKGDVYVFVFNLQVFCVISGFLYKKSPNLRTCIQKCFWQLLVPTVILSTIMHLDAYLRCMALGQPSPVLWPWFFKWLLLGHRWCMGPCWYFYSLIVIRLIMQLLPEKKWVYALLFCVVAVGAIYLHEIDFKASNSNINVLLCMPFFVIGVFLKPYKNYINSLHDYPIEIGVFVLGVIMVIMCGQYNGYVWMYLNGFGNNYILYILGGMAGTVMLYSVSLWLSRLPYRTMATTISKGSILIIGLHIIIVRRLTDLPDRLWGEELFFSLIILLCFVPIIRFAELFFPVLLGRHQ